MTTEHHIPPLSYWSAGELAQAITAQVLFLIQSNMGGSFTAKLKSCDPVTGLGTFEIDHVQAGDFHGKTALEALAEVSRVRGPAPAFLSNPTWIAAQNDAFRASLGRDLTIPGQIVFTHGINDKGSKFGKAALMAVQNFNAFTEDNNPHRERDFGAIEIEGETVFWKIDLYDAELRAYTPEPANPAVTRRVLTVMLASEY